MLALSRANCRRAPACAGHATTRSPAKSSPRTQSRTQPTGQKSVTPTGAQATRSLQCAAAAGSAGGAVEDRNVALLGFLFTCWYGFTIFFNIYNKQLLKAWMFPMTATCIQFFVGGCLGLAWFAVTRRKIVTDWAVLQRVLPLAVVHVLANTLTNVSLGLMAVSFTHTVKAMEPFFSVALSMLFLGERPHPLVLVCLLPIVGGVIGASLSEISFTPLGFAAAMGSNLSLCFRNVLSKQYMTPEIKQQLGGAIGLFSMITILAFLILAPASLIVEGYQLTPAAFEAAGVTPKAVLSLVAMTALAFHAYQQVSYMILSRVSPVSHSIGNTLKRVVVIVVSVLFFKNPMSQQSAISTAIALFGVAAYSQAKRFYKSKFV